MATNDLGYTPTIRETFARLVAVAKPTLQDFRDLALIEAAGKSYYDAMIRGATNDEIKRLFTQSGREEVAHAMRVKRAVQLIYGEEIPVPTDASNPYVFDANAVEPLTPESLEMLARGEAGGEAFYERWASALEHEEAAELLRQNGREETRHGERALKALALLTAA